MPFLAAAAPYIALATTAVNAYSQNEMGKVQQNQMLLQAIEDKKEANATQAIAQREAQQERRKARYLRSRALAVAGASGAGVGDKQISDILADIDTEGEMSALNILYSGDERARVLRSSAAARRSEGKAYRSAATGRAVGTLAGGFADFAGSNPSFFQKYGGERAQQSMGFGTGYSDFARMPRDEVYV